MNLIRKLLTYCVKKIKSLLSNLRNYLRQSIYPGYYAVKANKIIDKDYDLLNKKSVATFPSNIDIDAALEQLQMEYAAQMDRKKTIEDKAKSILATISISITAITFSLNYEKVSYQKSIEIISLVILMLSICYFIMGTIRAIQTINIRSFNVSQTQTSETNSEIKLIPLGTNVEQLQDLIKAKLLNDKIILKLGNFAWASFILVRNGIILFALYFIVSLIKKANIDSCNLPSQRNDTITIIIPQNAEVTNLTIQKRTDTIANAFTPFLNKDHSNYIFSIK